MKMPTAATRVLGTALLATAMIAASSETVAGQLPGPRLVEIFSDMSPQRDVQIVTPLLFLEDARFSRLGDDFVEVTTAGTTIPVDLDQIRAVSLKNAHPVQGTLWGIGVGALVGGMSGLMISAFRCKPTQQCDEVERNGLVRWGTISAITGGVAGFVIGRYTLTWQPVFP